MSVRKVGEVEDIHGGRITIGVDHGAIVIGPWVLTDWQQEVFCRHLFEAIRQAEAYEPP
jgi:hypothetical protein